MADRMAAEIWIGGSIPESLVEALCGHIRDESVSLNYGEASFDPRTAQELLEGAAETGGLLRLCDDEVAWGQFSDLENWLREHDIPYTRKSDGKYEHDPVVVEFRPDLGLPESHWNKASGSSQQMHFAAVTHSIVNRRPNLSYSHIAIALRTDPRFGSTPAR